MCGLKIGRLETPAASATSANNAENLGVHREMKLAQHYSFGHSVAALHVRVLVLSVCLSLRFVEAAHAVNNANSKRIATGIEPWTESGSLTLLDKSTKKLRCDCPEDPRSQPICCRTEVKGLHGDRVILENGYQALRGHGGGMDILEDNELDTDQQNALYRPWHTRFELQPYDVTSMAFMKPENRVGYRQFYVSNPYLALVPNSRDRHAQSTVEMAFGLTAMAAVIGVVLLVYDNHVLSADELELGDYRRKMLKVVILAALPWILLDLWLWGIFAVFVFTPMRFPESMYHWQCSGMVWFLLAAPVINSAYFIVNALWVGKLFYCIDKQAPMGRMFNLSRELVKDEGGCWIMDWAISAHTRYFVLALEILSALFGYLLISFRWGANSHFCQPEAYWATTALVYTAAIIVVFSFLACTCSICLRLFTMSNWMQDFADSFYEGRLHSKAKAMEKRETKARLEELHRAKKAREEDEFLAWYKQQQDAIEEETQAVSAPVEHFSPPPPPPDMTAPVEHFSPPRPPPGTTYTSEETTEAPVVTLPPATGSQGFLSPFAQPAAMLQPNPYTSVQMLPSPFQPVGTQSLPSPFQPFASGPLPQSTATLQPATFISYQPPSPQQATFISYQPPSPPFQVVGTQSLPSSFQPFPSGPLPQSTAPATFTSYRPQSAPMVTGTGYGPLLPAVAGSQVL
jgi:hypothetical protein